MSMSIKSQTLSDRSFASILLELGVGLAVGVYTRTMSGTTIVTVTADRVNRTGGWSRPERCREYQSADIKRFGNSEQPGEVERS